MQPLLYTQPGIPAMESMHGHRPWWVRFATYRTINIAVLLFSATLIAVFWLWIFATLRTDRAQTIDAAEQRNAALAIAFEQYTIRTIESADAILRLLVREYARGGERMNLSKFVADYTIDNKALAGIVLADERGDSVATTYSGVYAANIADREYFRVHLDRDSGAVLIGKPILGRISGKIVIPITRRINKADGTFGGVAMALIEPSRFADMLRNADSRPFDLISLVGLDGIMRARRQGAIVTSGEDISQGALLADKGRSRVGHFFAKGFVDGVDRFFSYRMLPDYELVVTVGTPEADVLAEVLHRRSRYLWAAGLASAFIAGFAALLMLALAAQRRAAAAVVGSQSRFMATFDQAAVGIAHCDLNGRYLEVNQRLCDILGYSRLELLARRYIDVTHPDDMPANGDVAIRLQREPAKGGAIEREKRYLRKTGETVWCAITVSGVHDNAARIQYVVVVVRDIMDRKRAEAALLMRTERLQQLSRQLMSVQERERRCLGRELHDRTGANLSALLLSLEVLRGKLPPGTAAELRSRMDGCEVLLRETIGHVRDVLGNLRPPALDELGLLAALSHYVRTLAHTGSIEFSAEGSEPSPRLAADVEVSLFRIAQESINNATRHAKPTRITVALQPEAAVVTLSISDDGKGFDAAPQRGGSSSLGLLTMRERAEAMNALLVVESFSGKGTRIAVIVPHRSEERGSPA